MKTKLIKIAFLALAAISFSCTSSDSYDNNQEPVNTLRQKIVYIPNSTSYISKLETNYSNSQQSSEINYNGNGEVTQIREFTYGLGTSTASSFNAQHIFQGKTVYNYDTIGKISTIEYYNSQNQLISSINYVYEGNDINVFDVQNGISTLIHIFKTNSSNQVYYEKRINGGLEQTLTYTGTIPTQLSASSGLQLTYEYFPTILPLAMQKNVHELNNSMLIPLSIQQIKDNANYYLYKAGGITSYTKYEKEFNAENYVTRQIIKSIVNNPYEEQITGEIVYFYN